MGLSLTDVCSLVTKGYKVDDLKSLGELLKNKDDKDASNIIELSKKLSFSDLQNTLSLLSNPDGEAQGKNKDDDKNSSQSGNDNIDKSKDADKPGASQDNSTGSDDVDYKALYEQEKKLREDLQAAARGRDISGQDDQKTDEELMLEITTDILN